MPGFVRGGAYDVASIGRRGLSIITGKTRVEARNKIAGRHGNQGDDHAAPYDVLIRLLWPQLGRDTRVSVEADIERIRVSCEWLS